MQPQHQLATWDSNKDFWTKGEDIFGHSDVYSETWPTSGMTANGVAYELPTWEPHTDGSGSSSLLPTVTTSETTGPGNGPNKTGGDNLRTVVSLLPTTTATDAKGSRNLTANRKPGSKFNSGTTLTDAVTLLPTPTVGMTQGGNKTRSGARSGELLLNGVAEAATEGKLLPTPRASDGTKGGPNQRGSSGDMMLPSAVHHLSAGDRTPLRLPDGRPCEEPPLPLPN